MGERKEVPWLQDFVAGSISGATSVVVGQPFDTVKVRLQTHGNYNGALDCLRCMVSREGWGSLFRGVTSPVLTTSLINAIVFATHGEYIRYATDQGRRPATLWDQFIGGSLGGLFQTSVLTPTDVVKCRMQVDNRYKNSMEVITSTLRTSGIAGFYKGHVATMLREVPSFGLYFVVYDHCKDSLEKLGMNEWFSSFIAGGLSGSLTWGIVYPIDLIKSVVQTASEGTDTRMATVARQTYERHGLGFFFRGFTTACIRAFPVNAVLFPTYELSLRLMQGGVTFKSHHPSAGAVVSHVVEPDARHK
mmetsp:Transcript_30517/g.97382  ORF Transcript_30517/g.97382 Transcript_30517/m.97382 type:complete len:304 (-) Transcript_30517:1548-2459(-)